MGPGFRRESEGKIWRLDVQRRDFFTCSVREKGYDAFSSKPISRTAGEEGPSPLPFPPPRAAGLSGENFATEQEGNRPNNFVLAGLGPAIHALEKPKQRRGCADQVRARRLGGDMSVYNPLLLQEKFPRTALRGAGEELRAECVV
jgi:hypothetical protein